MYKLLLCLRYLKTRYIALASIISVTLGVATMIVVNSVMAGFTTEMKDRIRGLLADVVVETHSLQGHPDPEALIDRAEKAAPGMIEAITPTVEMPAVMSFDYAGETIHRPVQLIGIDPRGKDRVSPLRDNLAGFQDKVVDGEVVAAAERKPDDPLGWDLTPTGRMVQAREQEILRWRYAMARQPAAPVVPAGAEGAGDWGAGAEAFESADAFDESEPRAADQADAPGAAPAAGPALAADPFGTVDTPAAAGGGGSLAGRLYVGNQLISVPVDTADGGFEERLLVHPGGRVSVTTVKTGREGKPESTTMSATVVDVFKSGMSEYDSSIVFCNIERLQEVRGMLAPSGGLPGGEPPAVEVGREVKLLAGPHATQTGQVVRTDGPFAVVRLGAWYDPDRQEVSALKTDCQPIVRSVTAIQIKLKPGVDEKVAVAALKREFPAERFGVRSWKDKQGPLLAAVDMETTILNVLLFLIVAVAGFGILAIFYMIVVEKTRDIGILKALGAGSRGILSIFLSYGLSLGVVGAGAGVALGLVFVAYINEVERFISYLTGRKVFDERIYYFPEIPTHTEPLTVLWVACGAVAIAVAASVLPARRAAALHPVQALRHE